MLKEDWIKKLFKSIDSRDADAFKKFLSDDVRFRFGNAQPAQGKQVVGDVVRDFFDGIGAISHDVREIWEQNESIICHGIVTYTRKDSSTLTVPFANVFKLDNNLIKEYLIFVDISELFVVA